MAELQLNGISLAYGARTLFKEATLNLSSGSRMALAGANGCGKSTLMKVIAGVIPSDSGTITRQKDMKVSYLPQSGIVHKGKTILEETNQAFNDLAEIEKLSHQTADLLSEEKDPDKQQLLAEKLHDFQDKLLVSDYYNRERIMTQILLGLGFKTSDLHRQTQEFSGGWQMRIALAKILCENPDIMLLDEPTNYLDLETRNWLEDFLCTYTGGLLIVSHDRYFLDRTINGVAELFLEKLKIYKGNYSEYEKLRDQEITTLMAAYTKQQEEIAHIEDFIRRFRSKATKAAQVQSRVKMLEKMERIVIPEHMNKIHFSFPQPPHSGKIALSIKDLNRSYGTNHVLKDLNLVVEKEERLVITGPNGAGKSTLLKILSGSDTDYSGELNYGTGVTAGYFAQDHEKSLNNNNTAMEEIESAAPTDMIPQVRNLMGAFLFAGDDVYKSVSVLSGGEKNRLSLLKLLLTPSNLLILDEPTNHLDLHSKDILLEALNKYTGTLIFVSHDRYFIENLATRVLELTPQKAINYAGDYKYYLWKKEQDQGDIPQSEITPEKDVSVGNLSYQQAKERKNMVKKLEKVEKDLLDQLTKEEEVCKELHFKMSLEENYSHPETARQIQKDIEKSEKKQHILTEKWEQAVEELENNQ